MALEISDYQDVLRRFDFTPHWDLPRWGNALAGEVGELCNIIKKIDRATDVDPTLDQARDDLGEEIADIIAYAVHLANKTGINVERALRSKFAKLCERHSRFVVSLPEDS